MPIVEHARLTIAEGSIDPDTRVANGEITEAEINDFAERSKTDEFDQAVKKLKIPHTCVDGRCCADGHVTLGGNAAGGTFTLVMADALVDGDFRLPGMNAAEHAEHLYGQLQLMGHAIGVHDDAGHPVLVDGEPAIDPNCGCGAEDKLDPPAESNEPSILNYIERRGGEIRALIESLTIEVSDDTYEKIMANATKLRTEKYATPGAKLREAATNVAGDQAVETLTGTHKEAILRINTSSDMRLDREKVKAAFNDKIQMFNLDLEDLKYGIHEIARDDKQEHEMLVAALFYNVATACVLAGPSLRVIVK